MSNVPLSESVIHKSLPQLSFEGVGAFECAVDPFHDRPIGYEGWPDAYCARSNKFTFTRQVVVPGDSSSSHNSDFLIHLTNELKLVPMQTPNQDNPPDSSSSNVLNVGQGGLEFSVNNISGQTYYGGLVVLRQSDGNTANFSLGNSTNWSQIATLGPFTEGTSGTIGNESDIFTNRAGTYRCIGAAFEVRNVTNELNVQGLTTAYRMFDRHQEDGVEFYAYLNGNSPLGMKYTSRRPLWPSTVAATKEYLETKDFKAKDGLYSVARFYDSENLATYDQATPLLVYDMQIATEDGGSWANKFVSAYPNILNTSQFNTGATNFSMFNHPIGFHQCGAFVTGCTPSTSLVITARWIIEYFPTTDDADLLVLATPSADYDPRALELVSAVMREMPVGVVVRDNASGDWFKNMMDVADQVSGMVMSMPGLPPQVRAVATGVQGVAKLEKVLNRSNKEFNKTRQIDITQKKPPASQRRRNTKGLSQQATQTAKAALDDELDALMEAGEELDEVQKPRQPRRTFARNINSFASSIARSKRGGGRAGGRR